MNKKVALLIVYNHRYDKNIKRVEGIYASRFSNIFHIVPFYDAKIEGVNVIPVYENSFYFQGYISQAYTHMSKMGFSHFLIIADDLMLNPEINEINLWEKVGIKDGECFIPTQLFEIHTLNIYWDHIWDAVSFNINRRGVEVKNILPSEEEARKIFHNYGLSTKKIPFSKLYNGSIKSTLYNAINYFPWRRDLRYPLVGGYSDTFLITADVMNRFCTYCGAFAATNLFVELAIPTSLILSVDKDNLKFDQDLKLHCGALWSTTGTISFLDKYEYSLDNLFADFPKDLFFLHPIKLSKWK